MNTDVDDDSLDELDRPELVAEVQVQHEQQVYFRAQNMAVALSLPVVAILAAVKKNRLKPDGYLVIDQDKFEPLFEAQSFDRVRKLLAPGKE